MVDPRDVPDARSVPPELPFWNKRVTLGEVRDGAIRFAKTVSGKLVLLEQRKEGAVLFVAWTGEWTTDILNVTEKDVASWLNERKRKK